MITDTKRKIKRGKRGGRRHKKSDTDHLCHDYETFKSREGIRIEDSSAIPRNDCDPATDERMVDGPCFLTGPNATELYQCDETEDEFSGCRRSFSSNLVPSVRNYLLGIECELDRLVSITTRSREENLSIGMLCQNVLTQLEGDVLTVAIDPDASRILEKIIWTSDLRYMLDLSHSMEGKWVDLSLDQFASHVCQTLLHVLCYKAIRNDTDHSNQLKLEFEKFLRTITGEFSDQILALITNKYASGLVNVLLCVLNLKLDSDDLNCIKSGRSKKYNSKRLLEYYRKSFTIGGEDLSKRVNTSDKFPGLLVLAENLSSAILLAVDDKVGILARDVNTVHILQRLLEFESPRDELMNKIIGLNNRSTTDAMISGKGIKMTFDPNFYSIIFHKNGSHLVEKLLKVANTAVFYLLYQTYFHNRLRELILDPVANFVVQTLLKCLKNSVQASVVIKELVPCVPEIIESNRTGVLASMFKISKLYGVYQKELSESFARNFDLERPDMIFQMLCLLPKLPQQEDHSWFTQRFNIQASLIMQSWLNFDKKYSRVLVKGMINLSPRDILLISCNPTGSHLIEAFFLCTNISNKSKKKMIISLHDIHVDLILNKYGSHVFEKLWISSDITLKKIIAHGLLQKQEQLLESQYGSIIFQKLKIDSLIKDAQVWADSQAVVVSKRKSIDTIFKEASKSVQPLDIRKIDPLWGKKLFTKDLFKWDASEEHKIYRALESLTDESNVNTQSSGKFEVISSHQQKKVKMNPAHSLVQRNSSNSMVANA